LAGQRPWAWRPDEKNQALIDRSVSGSLARDVEVSPLSETPLGRIAPLQRATHLAQRGVQPIAVAIRGELAVEVKVEPVTAQTGAGSTGRRPDRKQLAELVTRT
jgi:hypothetical protein